MPLCILSSIFTLILFGRRLLTETRYERKRIEAKHKADTFSLKGATLVDLGLGLTALWSLIENFDGAPTASLTGNSTIQYRSGLILRIQNPEMPNCTV